MALLFLMQWKIIILLLLAGFMASSADTIQIKARGTLTEIAGESFAKLSLSPGQAMEWEMSYSDEGNYSFLSQFGFVSIGEFREAPDLRVTLRAGNYTWKGQAKASERLSLRVIEFTDYQSRLGTGAAEKARFIAESVNGAAFSAFPGEVGAGENAISLELLDAMPPYAMIDQISLDVGEITKASGVVSTGAGNALRFTLDPASFEKEVTETRRVPLLSLSIRDGGVRLSWAAMAKTAYEIRVSRDLREWKTLGSHVPSESGEFSVEAGSLETGQRFFQLALP